MATFEKGVDLIWLTTHTMDGGRSFWVGKGVAIFWIGFGGFRDMAVRFLITSIY